MRGLVLGRIVVAGALLQNAIVPDSAGTFDFQKAYGLSSQMVGLPTAELVRHRIEGNSHTLTTSFLQALAISDHYPVEVTLKQA